LGVGYLAANANANQVLICALLYPPQFGKELSFFLAFVRRSDHILVQYVKAPIRSDDTKVPIWQVPRGTCEVVLPTVAIKGRVTRVDPYNERRLSNSVFG